LTEFSVINLPEPSADESDLVAAMRDHLRQAIAQAGGLLPFDRFMELSLYAPGLGYYVNGRRRFGEGGDFVTAPELSPLFGRCIGNYCAAQLERLGDGDLLEFGAGSGRLALDVLRRLRELDRLPRRYFILELSPDLRRQQAETLNADAAGLAECVEWLDTLPDTGFRGVVLANELLDAMPVHRFRRNDRAAWDELFVGYDGATFVDRWLPPRSPGLQAALDAIWSHRPAPSPPYESEVNLRLGPWLGALGSRLEAATVLLIDYGYTQSEYYHRERSKGTLICHYRQRAYAAPYRLPGVQDITANVDFTALARAAVAAGFSVDGFTTQAHFLIDTGLDGLLAGSDPQQIAQHLVLMQGVKKLTLPSEMGERFKVIGLSRGMAPAGIGFNARDLRDHL
jgi:SAM-dependent MidA family methyltransferase